MRKIQYGCPCAREHEFDPKYALKRVGEEIAEFVEKPSEREFSDIMYTISMLIHAIFPWWIWALPGSEFAIEKGLVRIMLYGCVRSSKNRMDHKKEKNGSKDSRHDT